MGNGIQEIIERVRIFLDKVPDLCDQEGAGADVQQTAVAALMRGRAVEAYSHSSSVFRTGGKPASASLSLWKAAYFLSFGLSYWMPASGRRSPNSSICERAAAFFEGAYKNADLGNPDKSISSQVHEFAMESFGWAYRAHQERLRKLLVHESKLLKWASPPLSQSMIVLGAYWDATWNLSSGIMNEDEVGISDMGAFPVHPRILAAFLKGRWRFREAFKHCPELPPWRISSSEEEKPQDSYELTDSASALYAFRFFVDAAEDGEAFEGGLELLNPPLAFIYYHLWLTLHVIRHCHLPPGSGDGGVSVRGKLRSTLESLRGSDEFVGERQRFFNEEFVKTKAKTLLREMWARHGNDEGFFAYAEKHYYLADSFSDPYVNGLWAVDYGLLPVATEMLKCLCVDKPA